MLKKIATTFNNLPEMIANDQVFIDKTRFIAEYEKTQQTVTVFLRPPYFGKTLFTELLKYYYDSSLTAECDLLLQDTYILKHPTPLKNSYYVLDFVFKGSFSTEAFANKVVDGILRFYRRYPNLMPASICAKVNDQDNEPPLLKLQNYYFDICRTIPPSEILSQFFHEPIFLDGDQKFLVIVDGYDDFVDDMKEEVDTVHTYIASFYNTLSYVTDCSQMIERIFITGVLPVTLESLVYSNISSLKNMNTVAGFTDEDVESLLDQTVDFTVSKFSKAELKAQILQSCGGYRFTEQDTTTVCNPGMCLNFVADFIASDCQTIPNVVNPATKLSKLTNYLRMLRHDRNNLLTTLDSKQPLSIRLSQAILPTRYFNLQQGIALFYYFGFLSLLSDKEVQHSKLNVNNYYVQQLNEDYKLLFAKRKAPEFVTKIIIE